MDNGKRHTNGNYGVSCIQIHIGKKNPLAEKDPSATLEMTILENGLSHISFHTAAEPTSAPSGHLLPREGGRIHTIPRTKSLPPYRHFERKREIFSVRGQAKDARTTHNRKRHAPYELELRCFRQTDSRRKETLSRKRSLGSARDDDTGKRTLSHVRKRPNP